jgi:carboxylesterase type B
MISVMNPIVETRGGKVRGSVVDGIMTFKGIPYAAPPFGATGSFPPLERCSTVLGIARGDRRFQEE